MNLHDKLSASEGGRQALSAARLRYDVLKGLARSIQEAGKSQAELASRLGVRRSAVNSVFRGNGNLRVNTIAEYLEALGYEARLVIQPAGQARQEAQVWRTLSMPVATVSGKSTPGGESCGHWSELGKATPKFGAVVADSKRSDFAIVA